MRMSELNNLREAHLNLEYYIILSRKHKRRTAPQKWVEEKFAQFESTLKQFSAIIGDREYIALGRLTLADFILAN